MFNAGVKTNVKKMPGKFNAILIHKTIMENVSGNLFNI